MDWLRSLGRAASIAAGAKGIFSSADEAAIRTRALLWAFKHGDSRLASAVVRGSVAFTAWRCAPEELGVEDFRAVYVALTTIDDVYPDRPE